MKVSHYIKQLGLIAGSVMLLAGMKAWAEPANDRHIVESALNEFKSYVSDFEQGLLDPHLQKNVSVPSLLLRRSMLLLRGTKNADGEFKSLKEFAAVEKAIRGLIDSEPTLKELSEKLKKGEPLRVKDLGAIEKAILTTKAGKALVENGTVAKLAEIVVLEVEKRLDGTKSSEDLLNSMARTKLTALPKEWQVGEGSPLLKKINGQLKDLSKEKAKKDGGKESDIAPPTLADLKQALETGNLTLSKAELLELNTTLAPMQINANGGFAAEDTLRELYRVSSRELSSPPSFKRILDSLAQQIPKPDPNAARGLRQLGQLPPQGIGRGLRDRSGGGGGNGFFSNNFPGGTPRFALDPSELALAAKDLSDEEKACLKSSKPQNYELTLSMGGGSLAACSSTPVAIDPEAAKLNPKPTDQEGMCEVNFFTAKHCVEGPHGLGAIQGLSIQGVKEPIGRAQVLVESTAPSVTGGDDSAVIRVEMSCAAAKTLSYQKPATSQEAAIQLEPREGTAMLIARNREINVESGGSNFLFARGYVPGSEGKFSGFAVTHDKENKGQVVRQGDSGGFQIGCVNGKPKLFGATSTVLITSPEQHGGRLGRAASLASLDWLNSTLRSGGGPPPTGLIANALRGGTKTNGATSLSNDKAVHPAGI